MLVRPCMCDSPILNRAYELSKRWWLSGWPDVFDAAKSGESARIGVPTLASQ